MAQLPVAGPDGEPLSPVVSEILDIQRATVALAAQLGQVAEKLTMHPIEHLDAELTRIGKALWDFAQQVEALADQVLDG